MSASRLSIQPADRVFPVNGYMRVDTGNAVQLAAGERTAFISTNADVRGNASASRRNA